MIQDDEVDGSTTQEGLCLGSVIGSYEFKTVGVQQKEKRLQRFTIVINAQDS